jgi:hypothetical protein
MLLREAAGRGWLERSGLSWLAVTGAGQLHRSGV